MYKDFWIKRYLVGSIGIVLSLILVPGLGAEEIYKEDFESGQAPGWQIKNFLDHLTLRVVEGGADGSQYAFEIRRDGPKKDLQFTLQSPLIKIVGGEIYTLQFAQKNTCDTSKFLFFKGGLGSGGKGGPASGIRWYDQNQQEISAAGIRGFGPANSNWHQISKGNLQAPANAVFARIQFGMDWPDVIHGGKYWRMDDIMLIGAGDPQKREQ